MRECVNNYFLYNDKVKKIEEFDDSFLSVGKSLYEVIRIIDGIPIFLEKHLDRLKNSAMITNLEVWMDDKSIELKMKELIKINDVWQGNIKIVFSFKDNNHSAFLAYFTEHDYPNKEQYEKGVSTILYHGERSDPNAKVINANFRKAVNEKITTVGAYEAILVDRNGNITEGSKSNIFMIKEDAVYTSPKEDVLPGITRDVILKICMNLGLQIREDRINYKNIGEMDALFISGTSPKVLPIGKVGNLAFPADNEVVKSIMNAYDKIIDEYIKNQSNKSSNIY